MLLISVEDDEEEEEEEDGDRTDPLGSMLSIQLIIMLFLLSIPSFSLLLLVLVGKEKSGKEVKGGREVTFCASECLFFTVFRIHSSLSLHFFPPLKLTHVYVTRVCVCILLREFHETRGKREEKMQIPFLETKQGFKISLE